LSTKKCKKNKKNYPYKELGINLRKLRGSLSKKQFARDLGVSIQAYYRYEKGERKIPDGLLKLAQIQGDGQSSVYNKDRVLDEDPEISKLLAMTRKVLRSDAEYSISLAANIRSFYNAVATQKRLNGIEARLSDLEGKKIKEDKFQEDLPVESVERKAM